MTTRLPSRRALRDPRGDRARRHGGRVPGHRHATNQRVALKLVPIEPIATGAGARSRALGREAAGAILPREPLRADRLRARHARAVLLHRDGVPRRPEPLRGDRRAGRCQPTRAVHVATQLCEFLEAAHAFERTLDGRQVQPSCCTATSSRATSACSMATRSRSSTSASRKRCRSAARSRATTSAASPIFRPSGSSPGRSTRRRSSGRSGVLLYEMVSGVQPFRAADTRRLEQRIRARRAPRLAGRRVPGRAAGDRRQAARAGSGGPLRQRPRHPRGSGAVRRGRTDAGRREGWPGRGATSRPPGGRTAPSLADDATRRHAAGPCASHGRLAPPCASHSPAAPLRPPPVRASAGSRAAKRRRLRRAAARADRDRHRHGAERDPHLHRRRRAGRERAGGDRRRPQPLESIRRAERTRA